MSFGSKQWEDWVLEEEESREIIDRAIDLGITFFDTANMYSNGESERVLGDALSGYDRDELVVATKTHPTRSPESYPPISGAGLSRKAIEQDIRNSLDRLGMETVDLYQTHRWDYDTPIAETLRTLDDLVHRGQVRYIGTSSMWTYQFATALQTSDRLGIARFATMQNHYNAVYREEEREMLPFCENEGIGVIPWSPLAQGYLARKHEDMTRTARGSVEPKRHDEYRSGAGAEINERVAELADDKDVTMAQIALAWLLHKERVDAPIIGTTSIEHLEDAVNALDITLSKSDLDYIEEPYKPVPVSGPY